MRAVAAAVSVAVGAWIYLARVSVISTARSADQPIHSSTSPSVAEQITGLGALKFSIRLEDAADENVFSDLPVVVAISHVLADGQQCHISYRRQFELDDSSREEQRSFALGDIGEVKVEPFESFENEHQGRPGWVYTMTDPEISALVITHADGSMDWFAARAGEMAKRLAEDIRRRAGYCRHHGEP